MRIKAKMTMNAAVAVVTVLVLVSLGYISNSKLGALQDRGAQLAADAENTMEAAATGVRMYKIIADAELNRNLEQTAKDWGKAKEEGLKDLDDIVKVSDTPDEKKWAAEGKKALDDMISIYENKMLPLLKATKEITPAILAVDDEIDKTVTALTEVMSKFRDSIDKEAKEADKQFDATRTSFQTMSAVVGIIGLILVILISITTQRGVMKPLNEQLEMLKDMAQGEGDLTRRLDDKRQDEFGELGIWFNQFVEKLRMVIEDVASTATQVASASNQLHSTAEQIATGAEEVASQTSTVATAAEEMAATSSDIAQNCQHAADNAKQASSTATSGATVVRETIDGMTRIATQVQGAAKTVESLGARSDQIGEIVATIQDIADQTNLLALNAAIEAARAGEQGRGFAVVADEVRALAERTTKATREISEMIKAIQNETKGAVTTMEDGVREVEKGTESSIKSGRALEEILEQVNEVAGQINQIATAVEEQTATSGEISSNIMQVTEVVQQSARGANETAAASGQLSSLAEKLQNLVSQFKLS